MIGCALGSDHGPAAGGGGTQAGSNGPGSLSCARLRQVAGEGQHPEPPGANARGCERRHASQEHRRRPSGPSPVSGCWLSGLSRRTPWRRTTSGATSMRPAIRCTGALNSPSSTLAIPDENYSLLQQLGLCRVLPYAACRLRTGAAPHLKASPTRHNAVDSPVSQQRFTQRRDDMSEQPLPVLGPGCEPDLDQHLAGFLASLVQARYAEET